MRSSLPAVPRIDSAGAAGTSAGCETSAGSGGPVAAGQAAGSAWPAQLRVALEGLEYTQPGLKALWGPDVDQALSTNDAAPALWFARTSSASLAVVARLFLLADAVPTVSAEDALGAELVSALQAAGLLVPADDGESHPDDPSPGEYAEESERRLVSSVSIAPYSLPVGVPRLAGRRKPDTLYLASDFGTLTRPEVLDGDFVLGLGGAGRTLIEITPREAVTTAADIGTGCGIQALALALHADTVIATDISERALEFTRLNAKINGVGNIETRQGSLLEPLHGQTVDLLVTNPPFVITPQAARGQFEYRDGGMPGDQLMRSLVRDIPHHLSDGGQAAMLGNWEVGQPDAEAGPSAWHKAAQDEAASADEAAVGTAAVGQTSLMVIEREQLSPTAYAHTWIRDGGVVRASEKWNADTAAWLNDFASRGVEQIAFGWVRFKRNAGGEPVVAAHRVSGPLGANAAGVAAFLDTRMAMLEWLAGAEDSEIADTAFVRGSDIVEHRHHTPGSENPSVIEMAQGTGFGQTLTVDTALAAFIGVADGTMTLRTVAGALAALLEVDSDKLCQQLVEQVRDILPLGFVYPVLE
ncbi:class I SAM-dependent methyltransferase [Brevibacterium ravenspurgense]|uniref:N5-glutamine methyltransferase family protein n=1 Tax=Brevibacterium ravenspurgense TaxID=479117 RepID=UPI001EF2AA9F|nr:class I SAM-dependent methyltransferase [Brevibacterium ravenspurgense]MCG7300402.1 class I SAM-dependent methyltransferase [Brevibacterium ravenspurgense]